MRNIFKSTAIVVLSKLIVTIAVFGQRQPVEKVFLKRQDGSSMEVVYDTAKKNLYLYSDGHKVSQESYFEVNTDQDILAMAKNFDKDFTMGVVLNWHKEAINSKIGNWLLKSVRLSFLPDERNWLLRKKWANKPENSFYSHGIIFSAFTPYAIQKYEVDSTDRPFSANFLFNSRRVVNRTNYLDTGKVRIGKQIIFEGVLGLIGKTPSNIAQFVQSGIHAGQSTAANDVDYVDTRPIPRGWPNAIASPKSKRIYQYSIGYKWNFLSSVPDVDLGRKFKVFSDVGYKLDIGNLYNSISPVVSGVEIGWFDRSNFGTSNNFNKRISRKLGHGSSGNEDDDNKPGTIGWFGISFLAGYELTMWGWNSNLQGVLWDTETKYRLRARQIERFTHYFEYGVRVKFFNWYLAYTAVTRSQVAKLDAVTRQSYGRISIMVRY